jgi:type I restriction enzyme S subunit
VVLTGHGQNAAYLAHILNSEPIAKQKAAAGKGHSVVHIHAPDLAKLLVPLPSLSEQNKVAAALEAIEEQIGLNLAIVSHLRTQKRGLMQRLLTGQLRVSERIDALLPGPIEVAA